MNLIPENAKKVFEGVIFRVYQWEQKLFDGTTTTFERVHRIPASFIIPVVGDTIVIQHEEQPARPPFISFPGGRFDSFDEDGLVAAKRELLEETGFVSDDWELWQEGVFRGSFAKEDMFFIARDCKKIEEPKGEPGEKIRLEYVTFDQLLDLGENPEFRLQDVSLEFLKMKLHPEYKEQFRKKLFG